MVNVSGKKNQKLSQKEDRIQNAYTKFSRLSFNPRMKLETVTEIEILYEDRIFFKMATFERGKHSVSMERVMIKIDEIYLSYNLKKIGTKCSRDGIYNNSINDSQDKQSIQ